MFGFTSSAWQFYQSGSISDAEGDRLPLIAIRLQLHTIADVRIVHEVVDAHGINAVAIPLPLSRIEVSGFYCPEGVGELQVFFFSPAYKRDVPFFLISWFQLDHCSTKSPLLSLLLARFS